MGAIRSLPENQVTTTSGTQKGYYYVNGSLCGWQFFMQDFHVQISDQHTKLIAVIDGHNGPQVGQFCKYKIQQLFKNNDLIKLGQIQSGLQILFNQLDTAILKSHQQLNIIRGKHGLPILSKQQMTRSGCCIGLIAITDEQIIICNIGMCRCYATYKKDKSKAILFSGNHIVSNKEQEARVIRNNGFICDGKINGIYPYTRSIGDLHVKKLKQLKQIIDKTNFQEGLISNQPSFFCLRKQDISSILIGTSGVWQQSQKVSQILVQFGKGVEYDKQKMQEMLSNEIAVQPLKQKLGLQNMTATYICFNH